MREIGYCWRVNENDDHWCLATRAQAEFAKSLDIDNQGEKAESEIESVIMLTDGIKRKYALILQGIGKWNDQTVEGWIESAFGDLQTLFFLLGMDLDRKQADGMSQRLEIIRCCLEEVEQLIGGLKQRDVPADSKSEKNKADSRLKEVSSCGSLAPFMVAAVWCSVLACHDFDSMWIYQISKWAICGVAGWGAWRKWKRGDTKEVWLLGGLAILFNPLAPIDFKENQWKVIDWVAAAVFLWHGRRLFSPARHWCAKCWRQWPSDDKKNFFGAVYAMTALALVFVVAVSIIRCDIQRAEVDQDPDVLPSGEKKDSRKYPRALPGGGLDWSGVEGGVPDRYRDDADDDTYMDSIRAKEHDH